MAFTLNEVKELAKRGNVVPLTLEVPADLLTPVSAYLRLAQGGRKSFLLESVEGAERLSRYSFIGADPFESLIVRDGSLSIKSSTGSMTQVAGNPFDALGRHLAKYRAVRVPELPPFTGGAVGYLGYECARFIEKLGAPEQRVGPYDAYLMVFRNIIAFDHVRHKIVLIHNLFVEEGDLKAAYERGHAELRSLRERLEQRSENERTLILRDTDQDFSLAPGIMGEEAFCRGVEKIKKHIRKGDIFQCVISDLFELPLKSSAFRVYRSLRSVSPAPYLFYIDNGEECLLGASPEMLARVGGDGQVETRPIAGTRPRGQSEAEDKKFEKHLLASVKERAEHLMLVDLARNDLGRVCRPGSVGVEDYMHIERFSHVMHLVSNVSGRLGKGVNAWQALKACFPAGTLSGAPKIRAMELIAETEPIQRGPYGGAVVYYDFSGSLDSCITIRSLYVRGQKAYLRAGAGIIADSRPKSEYQEVLNKSRALRRALALAEESAGLS